MPGPPPGPPGRGPWGAPGGGPSGPPACCGGMLPLGRCPMGAPPCGGNEPPPGGKPPPRFGGGTEAPGPPGAPLGPPACPGVIVRPSRAFRFLMSRGLLLGDAIREACVFAEVRNEGSCKSRTNPNEFHPPRVIRPGKVSISTGRCQGSPCFAKLIMQIHTLESHSQGQKYPVTGGGVCRIGTRARGSSSRQRRMLVDI